ncbi:MAG: pancreas/duodenum homeobox protein 1 [Proteobacteria bacterium]|nr:pancreas/duodenum homeobox protein 1 [Pseudomonadota bacterium]
MQTECLSDVFTPEAMKELFPADRTDRFFEALFGDTAEGAYDISLEFKEHRRNGLEFGLHLTPRPGKCLSCGLTFGLPDVFARHPIINIKGLIQNIDRILAGRGRCVEWQLGLTREISNDLHIIPLNISLDRSIQP